MRNTIYTILCFLCMTVTTSYGQYVSVGTDPTSIRWREINTNHFTVVYPETCDSIAQNFTRKLEFSYDLCGKGLKHSPKKIPVVIHPKTNISNASVAWCPKQMDVYTISPQDQNSQEWYENLSLHESRHVVQMDKLNQGTTRVFSFILGEQSVGIVSGLYMPRWFLEGDAVCSETALSHSGRGRQADFSMGLKAQCYDKGVYSYSKAYFGSYKDYVPNYYEMGYFLLANSRKYYGPSLEADIIDRSARHPFSFRPVNHVIKERTEMSKREWYTSVFERQANEWKLAHDREIQTSYDTIAKAKKVYTNYVNGIKISDSLYFAERKGLNTISQLVRIRNGKECVVANTGFKPSNDRIQSNGKMIVWQETNFHIRWELKQNSYIYVYDIQKNKTRKIRTKRHVYAPAISPSNERIVASEVSEDGKNFLTVFDRQSKKVLRQIPIPNNDAVQNASWNENGSKIIYVGLNSQGKRIVEYDVQSQLFTEILPYSYEDYKLPIYWKEYVLYTSSYSGNDNIYAYNPLTNQTSRVTVGDFGCNYPSTTDSTLVFSNYTSNGYQLAAMPLNPKSWHDIQVVKKENYNLAQMLSNQEGFVDFSHMPDTVYESKSYSKLLHAFRIHSWMPFYMNYENSTVSESGNGFQVLSQNHLGTLISRAGYRSLPSSGQKDFFANISYRGIFPVIEAEAAKGVLQYSELPPSGYNSSDTVSVDYSATNFFAKIYFPLNFSSKSYYRSVVLGSQFQAYKYVKNKITPIIYTDNYYDEISSNYFAHFITLSNYRQKATQEINPRFGQIVSAGVEHTPFASQKTYNEYLFAKVSLYLPGIIRSHSLSLVGGYETNKYQTDETTYFLRQIPVPRGYTETLSASKEMMSVQFNYSFPLLYPDLELGDILYIKRIRCNLFCDYAEGTFANSVTKNYLSYGGELTTDCHIINFVAPFNTGVRMSYMPNNTSFYFEFMFAVNFDTL